MRLTIDRKRWLRGEGGSASMLRRENDRKMCCIGFLARACKVPSRKIAGVSTLHECIRTPKKGTILERVMRTRSTLLASAYCVNDNTRFKPATRERRLKEIFSAWGINLTFKG